MNQDCEASQLDIIAISFTNRCNLSCTHCGYDHLNRNEEDELGVDFFERILAEGKAIGASAVNITGGEIFIRSDCEELIAKACELGFYVTLESNGTLLKNRHLDFLQDLGSRIRIAISLDGLSETVHDSIRGQNAFARTMPVLRKIAEKGIPARINTVMQKSNLNEIMPIAKFAVDNLGIGFRLLPFILEYGKGACACKTSGVSYETMRGVLEKDFFPFIRERGHPQNITVGLNIALVPIDIEGHLICPWGRSMIGVGPTGIASLCHVSNNHEAFVFGDLQKQNLCEVWQKNKEPENFRSFDPDLLQGICGNCLARSVCRGGCRLNAFSVYKSFFAPDSQCQSVYDLGYFPEYALEDPKKDSSYPGQ